MNKRVFLSPSSQERNIGVVQGYIEENICNQIARVAGDILIQHGVDVMYNNPNEDYKAHTKRSNDWKSDVHIAIHTNAAKNKDAEGMTAGCYNHEDKTRESTKLTMAIFDELAPVLPSLKDKIGTYRFHEVVFCKAPVTYLELLFHTNMVEAAWMMEDQNIQKVGLALAKGILKHLGIPYVAPKPKVLYRVQVGAFGVKANAEALQAKLKAAGFDGFITVFER